MIMGYLIAIAGGCAEPSALVESADWADLRGMQGYIAGWCEGQGLS